MSETKVQASEFRKGDRADWFVVTGAPEPKVVDGVNYVWVPIFDLLRKSDEWHCWEASDTEWLESRGPEPPKPKPYRGQSYYFSDPVGMRLCYSCALEVARQLCSGMVDNGTEGERFYCDYTDMVFTRRNPYYVLPYLSPSSVKEEVERVGRECEDRDVQLVRDKGLDCMECGRVMATPKQVARMLK